MSLGCTKDEHFSCILSSCQLGLMKPTTYTLIDFHYFLPTYTAIWNPLLFGSKISYYTLIYFHNFLPTYTVIWTPEIFGSIYFRPFFYRILNIKREREWKHWSWKRLIIEYFEFPTNMHLTPYALTSLLFFNHRKFVCKGQLISEFLFGVLVFQKDTSLSSLGHYSLN